MAPLAELLGNCPGIRAVREKVARLLSRSVESRRLPPVPILGETGTGKGLLVRAMLFQVANGGTIFLDEIGLMPESLQARLLKVIEDKAVRRLGSTQSAAVDVWVIAASNADLAEAASGGSAGSLPSRPGSPSRRRVAVESLRLRTPRAGRASAGTVRRADEP